MTTATKAPSAPACDGSAVTPPATSDPIVVIPLTTDPASVKKIIAKYPASSHHLFDFEVVGTVTSQDPTTGALVVKTDRGKTECIGCRYGFEDHVSTVMGKRISFFHAPNLTQLSLIPAGMTQNLTVQTFRGDTKMTSLGVILHNQYIASQGGNYQAGSKALF